MNILVKLTLIDLKFQFKYQLTLPTEFYLTCINDSLYAKMTTRSKVFFKFKYE